jgi:hypothetical protein
MRKQPRRTARTRVLPLAAVLAMASMTVAPPATAHLLHVLQLPRLAPPPGEPATNPAPVEGPEPTLVPPAPALQPATAPGVAPPRQAARPATVRRAPAGDSFARLRSCESGGNYGANTRNRYFGAYQMSRSTWRSLGYGGLPHQAPPQVQDEAARRLQSRSGWGQWPACSRKLRLR